jgi:transposase
MVDLGQQRHPRPPACGGRKKGGNDSELNEQALGRSRGGFSTKLHVCVNGLGLPVEFKLTPGQAADITQAEALLENHDFEFVLGDKGFDSKKLIGYIQSRGAEAVIPPRSNLKDQREYDRHLYKERNLVERFISRIKQFRRVATRYEKTARNFLAFVHLASITVLWQ